MTTLSLSLGWLILAAVPRPMSPTATNLAATLLLEQLTGRTRAQLS